MGRRLGWMALEVMVIALVYTVMIVILGATTLPHSGARDLARLLLVDLLAVLPVVVLVWWAEGTWWTVGATAVLALGALQTLVPQLETALERQSALGKLPAAATLAVVAASVAVGVFLFMMPEDDGLSGGPPYPWLVGGPVAYLWRVLALTGAYACLHVAMMRLGRSVFEQVARVGIVEELGHRAVCGLVVVAVLLAVAVHLPERTRVHGAILVAILVVIGGAGRWTIVAGWPAEMAITRVGLRAVADLAVGLLAVRLLLPRGDEMAAEAPAPDRAGLPAPGLDDDLA